MMEATGLDSEHSDDVQTEGFDLQAGKSWIYPTNYPMREYQFRIAQEALYQNTLVSLPTGLGKTFIAAVVMFNFYRWYPSGKVIFMAPTRPLVKQQIDACYDIMAIPQNVTAELTGSKMQSSREEIWNSKRVFFVTPQVLQNDLDSFPDLGQKIKCLVFDEAHKAKGNHAYCEVIRKMVDRSKYFRVLALSATPGSSVNDVIDLAKSLLIAHLEVRTEDSPDVAPYVFHRTLETVVVPLGGKLEEIKNKYLQILERYVRVLKDHRVIMGNCANLTKGKIFMTLKNFTNRSKHNKLPNHGEIVKTLNICITLYHGYELLIRHGLRGFLNFFEEHSDKALLRSNTQIFNIMAEVQNYIGPRPDIELLPDGTIPEIPHNSKFGHPKFYKLRQIMVDYYNDPENASRKVIIFSEFKETVLEAYAMLMQHTPLIKPRYFMGQGAITQKQQINIIKSFKEGGCNTLISTCIGEEGLDIGEVDLIICFDISNKSPIRLVQRMGRTGRKKQGKVIILVTVGKEQELLKDCIANKKYLSDHILKSKEITKNLYGENPRMIPTSVFPSCQKMHISVPKPIVKKKSGNLKDLFNNLTKFEPSVSQVLNDIELIENEDRIPDRIFYWNKRDPLQEDRPSVGINYSRRVEVLRNVQSTEKIGHSKDTEILASLLQFADAKRYNLPITQLPGLTEGRSKGRFGRTESTDNLKQTDIRNLFFKPKTVPEGQVMNEIEDVTIPAIVIEENLKKQKFDRIMTNLQSEISTYIAICYTESTHCDFCKRTSLCNRLKKPKDIDLKISEWVQPDFAAVDGVTADDLDAFLLCLSSKENTNLLDENDFDALNTMMDVDDESFVFNDTPKKETTFLFKAPDSIKKVFDRCNISVSVDEFERTVQAGDVPTQNVLNEKQSMDYSDLFDDSVFGLSKNDISDVENSKGTDSPMTKPDGDNSTEKINAKKLDYSDLFDDSIFGLSKMEECRTSVDRNSNISKENVHEIIDILESPVLSSGILQENPNTEKVLDQEEVIDLLESPVVSSGLLNRSIIADKFDQNITPHIAHKTIKNNDSKLPAPISFDEIMKYYRATLDFFKLNTLEDLFDDPADLSLLSPDIFNDSPEERCISSMPSINTNNTGLKAARKLFSENNESADETFVELDDNSPGFCEPEKDDKNVETSKLSKPKPCLANISHVKKSSFYTPKRQIEDLPKKETITKEEANKKEKISKAYTELFTNLQDVCDLSIFGFPTTNNLQNKTEVDDKRDTDDKSCEDTNICEDSDSTCVNTADLEACNSDASEDLFGSPPHNKKLNCATDDFCNISSFGFSPEFYSKMQEEKRLKDIREKPNTGEETKRSSQLSENKEQIGRNVKITNREETDADKTIINNEQENSNSAIDNRLSPVLSEKHNGRANVVQKTPEKSLPNNDILSPVISQQWNRKRELSKSPVLSQRFKRKPPTKILALKRKASTPIAKQHSTHSNEYTKASNNIYVGDLSMFQTTTSQKENKKVNQQDLEVEDVFDLSVFGLKSQKVSETDTANKSINSLVNKYLEPNDNITPLKSSMTVTQVLNQMNKTSEKATPKNRFDETLSYLLNDDNIFEENIPMPTKKTPLKNTRQTQKKTPSVKKTFEKKMTTQTPSTSGALCFNSDDEFEVSPFKHKGWIYPKKRPLFNETTPSVKKTSEKKMTTQTPSTSRALCFNSDDEFEVSPFKRKGWICPKKRPLFNDTTLDTTEFKTPKTVFTNEGPRKVGQRKKRRKGADNPFIEDEAVLSSDEYATDDTQSEGGNSQDLLEMSFVDDNTLDVGNDTTMHAKYLQSVRSPVKKGLYKIPDRPARNIVDVFSQIDTYTEQNTYMDDSFCVDVDDCELTQINELSELEIAEQRLEEQRKRKRKEKNVVNYKKRRRVMVISSSDSE